MTGTKTASIVKRLTFSVLALECIAAFGLVTAVTIHERDIQYQALDANLRAGANAILGAVQEGSDNTVQLDQKALRIPSRAVYTITDEAGRDLGSVGVPPSIAYPVGSFQHVVWSGRSYRFFTLAGQRVIDPEKAGGVHHQLHVVYGQPDGFVWHEVVEAVQFAVACTLVILGITAVLLVWLVRRLLTPVRDLALAAERVSVSRWSFDPPATARQLVELRPLTVAMEATLSRLQGAFNQQKRFTSDAAHELKTDLAIVKSSLQLITLRKRTVEEHERGLTAGLNDLTRLERTVEKMLALARLEQSAEPTGHSCRLDEALQEAVQQSESLATMKAVTVVRRPVDSAVVPLQHQDAVLLCSNVVINALQHSREKGTVEIAAASTERQVQLTVRDHGEGVRDGEAALLFEPFYRGDVSRSRKSGGTGLGLSICKALCERVGGTIVIANHPQGGAQVTIVLPLT